MPNGNVAPETTPTPDEAVRTSVQRKVDNGIISVSEVRGNWLGNLMPLKIVSARTSDCSSLKPPFPPRAPGVITSSLQAEEILKAHVQLKVDIEADETNSGLQQAEADVADRLRLRFDKVETTRTEERVAQGTSETARIAHELEERRLEAERKRAQEEEQVAPEHMDLGLEGERMFTGEDKRIKHAREDEAQKATRTSIDEEEQNSCEQDEVRLEAERQEEAEQWEQYMAKEEELLDNATLSAPGDARGDVITDTGKDNMQGSHDGGSITSVVRQADKELQTVSAAATAHATSEHPGYQVKICSCKQSCLTGSSLTPWLVGL